MKRHGWFVIVHGLEDYAGAPEFECAYTEMFTTKPAALRALRRFRRENANFTHLTFYLAKATLTSVKQENR